MTARADNALHDRMIGARIGRGIEVAVWIVLMLGVALGSAVVTLMALGLVDPQAVLATFGWVLSDRAVAALEGAETWQRLVTSLIAAVVGIGALTVLYRRFSSGFTTAATRHLITADERGFVVVDSRSIEEVATHAALRAPGVIAVGTRVFGPGTSPVRLRLDVDVHAKADVKRAGEESRDRACDAVQQLIGVQVSDAAVDVRVREPDWMTEVA